jgi:hypothetical protein
MRIAVTNDAAPSAATCTSESSSAEITPRLVAGAVAYSAKPPSRSEPKIPAMPYGSALRVSCSV